MNLKTFSSPSLTPSPLKGEGIVVEQQEIYKSNMEYLQDMERLVSLYLDRFAVQCQFEQSNGG